MMKKWGLTLVALVCCALLAGACGEEMMAAADSAALETSMAEDYWDSELLLEGYMEQVFYPGSAFSPFAIHDRLTAEELAIYNIFVAQSRAVADGQRADTTFTISPAELGLKVVFQESDFSEAPYSIRDNQLILNEAVIRGTLQDAYASVIDMQNVSRALLHDNPYNFYWLDNNASYSFNNLWGMGYSAQYSSVEGFSITLKGELLLRYPMMSDYSAGAFTADTAKTGAVKTAYNRAMSVVAAGAGKGDLERMTYYMQEIRRLSSYNYDAAGSGYTGSRSPWQLIAVFDGDPSTKVVCEGYSKAFKFLCDNTAFNDSSIEVYLATGGMGTAKSSGSVTLEPHMWNIVRTASGNYLVDVTNCLTEYGVTNTLFFSVPDGTIANGYYLYRGGPGTPYTRETIYFQYNDETMDMFTDEERTLTDQPYVSAEPFAASVLLQKGDRVALWSDSLGAAPLLGLRGSVTSAACEDSAVAELNGAILTAKAAGQTVVTITDGAVNTSLTVTVADAMPTFALPDQLTALRAEALKGTTAQRLYIPATLTAAEGNAFANMNALAHVVVPGGLPGSVLASLPQGETILWLCRGTDAAQYAASAGQAYLMME